jgi:hypothetical protein
MSRRLTLLAAAGAISIIAAACGSDADPVVGGSTTTTVPPDASVVVDWEARTVRGVDAPEGWTVAFCEGDGPILCVSDGDRHVGTIEWLPSPAVDRQVFEGRTLREGLDAIAADQLRTIAADRLEGCGADYRVRGEGPAAVDVGGEDGVRFQLRGSREGADRVVELEVTYATVIGDTLHLLHAGGLEDEGGCLDRMGEFLVDDLERFAPTLDAIAAGSRFDLS